MSNNATSAEEKLHNKLGIVSPKNHNLSHDTIKVSNERAGILIWRHTMVKKLSCRDIFGPLLAKRVVNPSLELCMIIVQTQPYLHYAACHVKINYIIPK